MEIGARGPRLPAAETSVATNPEIAGRVFQQVRSGRDGNSIRWTEALNVITGNFAERTGCVGELRTHDPDGAILVLYDRSNPILGAGVGNQLAVLRARQTSSRSYPQAAVACPQQRLDIRPRQLSAIRRGPGNEPYAIETQQTVGSSEPQVAVCSLRKNKRDAAEGAVLRSPSGVGVLRNSPVEIERADRRAEDQNQPRRQKNAQCMVVLHDS